MRRRAGRVSGVSLALECDTVLADYFEKADHRQGYIFTDQAHQLLILHKKGNNNRPRTEQYGFEILRFSFSTKRQTPLPHHALNKDVYGIWVNIQTSRIQTYVGRRSQVCRSRIPP
jgi:hypothetical protein